MRKLGPVAAVTAMTLLAGCGGSTTTVIESTTVTATVPGSGGTGTGAASSQAPPTSSAATAPSLPGTTAAAACFRAAGAAVRIRPAGQGVAVYAITRDSGNIGMLKGPNAAIASRIAQVFSSSGWKVSPVKSDSTAYAMYQGTLTSTDSALLGKCVK